MRILWLFFAFAISASLSEGAGRAGRLSRQCAPQDWSSLVQVVAKNVRTRTGNNSHHSPLYDLTADLSGYGTRLCDTVKVAAAPEGKVQHVQKLWSSARDSVLEFLRRGAGQAPPYDQPSLPTVKVLSLESAAGPLNALTDTDGTVAVGTDGLFDSRNESMRTQIGALGKTIVHECIHAMHATSGFQFLDSTDNWQTVGFNGEKVPLMRFLSDATAHYAHGLYFLTYELGSDWVSALLGTIMDKNTTMVKYDEGIVAVGRALLQHSHYHWPTDIQDYFLDATEGSKRLHLLLGSDRRADHFEKARLNLSTPDPEMVWNCPPTLKMAQAPALH